jgi:hypothetical protein
MLASITPLGERGRQATWAVTVAAFVLACTLAATAAGALLGAVGALALPDRFGAASRLLLLAGLGLLAIALDARAARVPGPRRQVDERWLDSYRGWVYGLGYGAQLGLGVTTVVSSAATYLALAAAFLAAGTGRGALILGSYGAVRGLSVLGGAHVRRPEQLISLHAALLRWRQPAMRIGLAVLVVVVAVAFVGGAA